MSWERMSSVSSSWARFVHVACAVAVGSFGVVVTIGVEGLFGCFILNKVNRHQSEAWPHGDEGIITPRKRISYDCCALHSTQKDTTTLDENTSKCTQNQERVARRNLWANQHVHKDPHTHRHTENKKFTISTRFLPQQQIPVCLRCATARSSVTYGAVCCRSLCTPVTRNIYHKSPPSQVSQYIMSHSLTTDTRHT